MQYKKLIKELALTGINSVKPKNLNYPQIKDDIHVIGFGKASSLMAKEAEKRYNVISGIVIDVTEKKLKKTEVIKGTHPLISRKNINATKKILKFISKLKKSDHLLCLISGGGSALFESPKIPLVEYKKEIKALIKKDINIKTLNSKRKKLSHVKGGQLPNFTKAKITSLIISDVIGNDINTIASGPTATKKAKNILIATNMIALKAISQKAKSLGLKPRIITDKLSGEVTPVAIKLEKYTKKMQKGELLLFGGETTVNVKGKGKGGRNQELTLRMIDKIKDKNITFCSIGSDGIDHSAAAGAIIDGQSHKKLCLIRSKYISNNDSYNYFKKTKENIIIGPTGTNIADIILIHKR